MTYKIVYIDEPTYLNTEFVSELAKRGMVELHFDRPSSQEVRERLVDADIAVSEWSYFTEDSIPKNGRLKHIALLLSAFDTVDLSAAAKAGVSVSNCSNYCVDAVAEHIIGCMYSLARRLPASSQAGMAGISHLYIPFLGRELRGATIGLIGIGAIGRAVAERAKQIGMHIIGCNRSGRPIPGVELKSIEDVITQSDVVTVQLPYTQETHSILNASLLSRAKPESLWINIGRFNLFCETSLEEVLLNQNIAGIALDDCPYQMLNAIRAHGNAIITPGTAWYTAQSRQRNLRELIESIDHIVGGGKDVSS